jgi:cytochrome b pre-mRNA-processing protein 3
MFKRLFGIGPNPNQTVVDGLYEQIVAAARQPVLYADWGVPDTPLGRFEMISLSLFLVLRRLRGTKGAAADVAQELVDTFFREVDHSIRELGIGDMGVPKRMKKLARMFYGRVESYGSALDGNDEAALAAALARNVWPGSDVWPQSADLARYAIVAEEALKLQPVDRILSGVVSFPPAGEVRSGEVA